MPTSDVNLVPGVNTTKTPSRNEAGISSSNLIRFREGIIEKRGGWSRYFPTAVNGVPKALWPWRDFKNTTLLAIGSTSGLYEIDGGSLNDITPRNLSRSLPNCFSNQFNQSNPKSTTVFITDTGYSPNKGDSIYVQDIFSCGGVSISGLFNVTGIFGPSIYIITVPGVNYTSPQTNTANIPTYMTTAGSGIVTVALSGHGVSVGTQYAITNPVTVGGLTLVGPQTVVTVINSNSFTIGGDMLATSSASQAAIAPVIRYSPNPTYGQAVVGTPITATDWSLGNYGNNLIACPVGGQIYQWVPDGPYPMASAIGGAPQASGIIISDAAQQIIAYGGNPLTLYDPNYIAWCDTGNVNTWTAAVGNQAGSYRIPTGSAVIGAAAVASNVILIWTDVDVWLMQYIGYPIVYSFTKIASGCGLIAQFAWAKLGTYTVWMSQNQFFFYDGQSVQPLDCPIYDNIFPILSSANKGKIRGGTNSYYNEMMFFFPSVSGGGENDMYACFNPTGGTWDYGTMPRSAWADQSIVGPPTGASPTGFIYQHETSPNADGVAMTPSFTTGLFQISEGEDFVFVDWIRPDFKYPNGVGTIMVTVISYEYADGPGITAGPYSFSAAKQYINTRCRGRFIALQFSGSDLGSFWRIGRTQVRFANDGRR